jgi:hypothetical protein
MRKLRHSADFDAATEWQFTCGLVAGRVSAGTDLASDVALMLILT